MHCRGVHRSNKRAMAIISPPSQASWLAKQSSMTIRDEYERAGDHPGETGRLEGCGNDGQSCGNSDHFATHKKARKTLILRALNVEAEVGIEPA